jgi:hypothetical protein
MQGMSSAKLAELFKGKPIGSAPLVFGSRVVPLLAFSTD